MIVSTSMIMWLVLTVHTSLGGELSTRQVFTLLSLLTTLRLSFHFFVLALLGFSEGRVAMQRIQVQYTHSVNSAMSHAISYGRERYSQMYYCKTSD